MHEALKLEAEHVPNFLATHINACLEINWLNLSRNFGWIMQLSVVLDSDTHLKGVILRSCAMNGMKNYVKRRNQNEIYTYIIIEAVKFLWFYSTTDSDMFSNFTVKVRLWFVCTFRTLEAQNGYSSAYSPVKSRWIFVCVQCHVSWAHANCMKAQPCFAPMTCENDGIPIQT